MVNLNFALVISITCVIGCPSLLVFLTVHFPASFSSSSARTAMIAAKRKIAATNVRGNLKEIFMDVDVMACDRRARSFRREFTSGKAKAPWVARQGASEQCPKVALS